ncbi:unnamed protein product, partial [Amoebophrya sp. A25]
VVNGAATGKLGTKCLFCLSELGRAQEREVLDLVEEILIPELQTVSTWQDEDNTGETKIAETLVTGLNFFGPTEPYFRSSIILNYVQQSSYFSRKMARVVRCLCEFYKADVASHVPVNERAHMSPQFVCLLKHCMSNRSMATLPIARETIPDMLFRTFQEKQIGTEETGDRRKMFSDYMRVTCLMIAYAPVESVRVLMPCLETWAAMVQQLSRVASMADMPLPTCGMISLLIDAIASMCAQSTEALNLIASKQKTEAGVIERLLPYTIDLINQQIAEPRLLSAGLRLWCIILNHSARLRDLWIEDVIRASAEKPAGVLELLLPYMGGKKYKALYDYCATILENADGKGSGEQKQVIVTPPLAMCYNMFAHEAFISLVEFVKVFTSLANEDAVCDRMSEILNSKGREKLLFSLLSVPDSFVQEAVMGCIRCVSLDELEEEEIAFLVDMLDVSKPGQKIQSGLLQAVLNQLRALCVAEGSVASQVFRSRFVEKTSKYVFDILAKNSNIVTYSKADADVKAKLNFACLDFLRAVSASAAMRTHLRAPHLSVDALPTLLKTEENVADIMDQDIFVERTWSGRNLEALLACLSGPSKLTAKGKQAFRVFVRIADVLEGRPDSVEPLSEMKHDVIDGRLYVDVLALREREMFQPEGIYDLMRRLDDQEWEDRVAQHQAFATFHGLDIMLSYLEGELAGKGEARKQKQHGSSVEWCMNSGTSCRTKSHNSRRSRGKEKPLKRSSSRIWRLFWRLRKTATTWRR